MRTEFDVKMTTGRMYEYMMRHTFTSFAGIMGECLGIVLIIGSFAYRQWLWLVAGIILALYQPVALYYRAARQVRSNEVFKDPLHYTLDDEGITVKSGDVTDSIPWKGMYKAVSTNHLIILYTTRINAIIFPKDDLADRKTDVIAAISAHMDPKQVNIRP